MLERVKNFAIEAHENVNHKYGTHTYEHHLQMVVDVVMKIIHLIDESDRENVLCACWLHDTIEDCRLTYNDIVSISNTTVADMVYALSNEKGKNRKERANHKYYNGIINTKYARFIKLCDRIANVSNSIIEKSRMLSVYENENIDFIAQLFPNNININSYEMCAMNMLNDLLNDVNKCDTQQKTNQYIKNTFNKMSVTPPPIDDGVYSQTVIVYEIDPKTKELIYSDLGAYDFEAKKWIVLGDLSMHLYCWCAIPKPKIFLQDKNWDFVTHKGYQE